MITVNKQKESVAVSCTGKRNEHENTTPEHLYRALYKLDRYREIFLDYSFLTVDWESWM